MTRKELFRLKQKAHSITDWHFGFNRARTYGFISAEYGKHHIADMDEKELKSLIKRIKKLSNKRRRNGY